MNPAATRPPPEAMTFLTSTQKNNNVCIENNYITFYLDEISQLGFKGNNPFDTAKYRNHGIGSVRLNYTYIVL
jgi:hypothetical protein